MNKKLLKRFAVAGSVLVGSAAGLVGIPWLATHHEQIQLVDNARNNRSVPVDIYYRWDKKMQAEAGLNKMPVVIISHGNTVKSSEYSFAANLFAARGYLALSIQHDLPGEPKLPDVAKQGTPYITRWSRYMLASANIDFVLNYSKQEMPFADYEHLTLFGHSQGGDDSVFYAKAHPDIVSRVIAEDSLRIPMEGDTETFTIRGLNGRNPDGTVDGFKADDGVVPCEAPCTKGNVTVEKGDAHHTTFTDKGPGAVLDRLRGSLSKFLDRPLPRKLKAPKEIPGVTAPM